MHRKNTKAAKTIIRKTPARRSSAVLVDGINTVPDLARFITALMSDVDTGAIEHKTAALQNGLSGKLLGIANLRARLGILGLKKQRGTLLLA